MTARKRRGAASVARQSISVVSLFVVYSIVSGFVWYYVSLVKQVLYIIYLYTRHSQVFGLFGFKRLKNDREQLNAATGLGLQETWIV